MSDEQVIDIKPFLLIRYIFGYSYNIVPSKNLRYLFKFISLLICLIITYTSALCTQRTYGSVTYIFGNIEYVVFVFCSFCTEDQYLIQFYRFNALIDDRNAKKLHFRLKALVIGYIVFIIASHFIFMFTYLFFHIDFPCDNNWIFHIMGTIRIAMKIGRLPVILVFGLLYCRVKVFCKKTRYEIATKPYAFRWKRSLFAYLQIIETLRKTDFPIKVLLFSGLAIGFIDISNVQYQLVTQFSVMYACRAAIHLTSNYMGLLFALLVMEVISEETEKLRIFVADKMIVCTDEKQRYQLREFLQNLRQQPMKYVIWRAIQVDARLLLTYLSLLVTSLVCMLQFNPKLYNSSRSKILYNITQ